MRIRLFFSYSVGGLRPLLRGVCLFSAAAIYRKKYVAAKKAIETKLTQNICKVEYIRSEWVKCEIIEQFFVTNK